MPTVTHIPYAAADSVWLTDTIVADTIPVGEQLRPIVVERSTRDAVPGEPRPTGINSSSWLLLGVLAVVCLVCVRYKSNVRYFKLMVRDLTNVRERLNMFDETASETSFMLMLNLMCAVMSGLMLYTGLTSWRLLEARGDLTMRIWHCIICTTVYSAVMPAVYFIVGRIFSDGLHTSMWVKGFLASQGLLALMLLVPALTALFYPAAGASLAICALCILAILKIIFISKTFRIFFAQFSSWVLFLYYLCTLEILPLVLTYSAALR